jgi:hypothetical protein
VKWDDLSVYPPELPKKNEIVPIHESGRNYPEGDTKEEPIKYYKVKCPRCQAQPGFPCSVSRKRPEVSYTRICIARVVLYEAFELGSVDVNGIGRSGQKWGPE